MVVVMVLVIMVVTRVMVMDFTMIVKSFYVSIFSPIIINIKKLQPKSFKF